MRYFQSILFLLVALCGFSEQSYAEKLHNQTYRDFWHPTYHGERLDFCSIDGRECGKQVADRYCQLLGYDYSSQNVIAHNLGLTNFLSTRAQCSGWRCNGFMTISCAKGIKHHPPRPYHYTEKKYVYPRFNHYRLDWCYKQNHNCGAMAANSFCSRLGYVRAKRFIKEAQISATKTIGSQELCFGNGCNSFREIICSR